MFELRRNHVLVVAHPGNDMPNAPSGVGYVSFVSRHHVNVGVHNGLTRMNPAVYSDIETIWIVLCLQNILDVFDEVEAGEVDRTRKFKYRLDVNFWHH
jgi:hypothetical protein